MNSIELSVSRHDVVIHEQRIEIGQRVSLQGSDPFWPPTLQAP